MNKILMIGGIFQILIIALHVWIFFGIASSSQIPDNFKVTAYIFNAAVTATVIFFAYVSFFNSKDLSGTKLGQVVCIFIAAFYLQRGIVELFLRGFDIVTLILSIIIAAIYIVPIFPSKR